MSFFGELFGEKKKTVRHTVSKEKKNSKARYPRKKKLRHDVKKEMRHSKKTPKLVESPGEKKRRDKVKKLVFNSDLEVENYYKQERERAKNLLLNVEKEKAVSLLEVAKKQYNHLKIERDNIDFLMRDLVSHAKNISEKVKELKLDKKNNRENIDLIQKLKSSFFKLEKEAYNIVSVRRTMADKEKFLLDKMSKLATDSVPKLRLTDNENAERLLETQKSKEKLLEEAKALLLQENYKMKFDDKVLDRIGNHAKTRIKKLNRKLKGLRKDRIELLKKKQLLQISEEKARDKLIPAEKNIDRIKKKYRKVLGLK
jgi:hypothetical protein